MRDGARVHLDDDELLFAPSGLAALRREIARASADGLANLHANGRS